MLEEGYRRNMGILMTGGGVVGCQSHRDDEDGGDGDRWWDARHRGRMRMEMMVTGGGMPGTGGG